MLVMTPPTRTRRPSTSASTRRPARSRTSPAACTARCGWATSRTSPTPPRHWASAPGRSPRWPTTSRPYRDGAGRRAARASTRPSTRCCRTPSGATRSASCSTSCGWSRTTGRSTGCAHACEATARGFADVARELPNVIGRTDIRGERWLEGTFWRRARLEGNDVGYTLDRRRRPRTRTTLHWGRNHGAVEPGTLLLADMGIETDELYTADVTRTMPVDGEWTPAQLRVYRAVQEAQAAGIAEVKAGRRLPGRAPGGHVGARRSPALVGHPRRPGRGLVRRGPETPGRRPAPPVHAARHLAHARHRRARLRAGPRGELPRRARWPPGTSSPSSRGCTSRSTT